MSLPIEVTHLAKTYREPVLTGLDLRISGGVVALLGANGAGKTTLVSILTTLVRPDSGTARICGHDVVRDRAAVRRRIAATGQEATLDDLLTGRENLVMMARLHGLSAPRERAAELLEQFDLTAAAGRVVGTYSGGMRRRLDLAASLLAPAEVLFLDEPTTGLDPISRRQVWEDVRERAKAGTTVLLTTQTLDEAEALADRVVVLRQGQIVADGTAASLAARVGGPRLVFCDADGQEVHSIDTDGSAAAVASALRSWTLQPGSDDALRVNLRTPTLDDAFVALTGEEVAA